MIFPAANRSKLNGTTYITLALFIMANLHLLRNVSQIYFLIYGGMAAITTLIALTQNEYLSERKNLIIWVLSFSLYIVIISLLQPDYYGSPATGLARFFFLSPLILILFATVDKRFAGVFFGTWLAFAAASALSLPLQYAFGPIGWFSESYERAGLERYGSLAGSLTTFGNIAGAAAFLTLVVPKRASVSAALLMFIIVGSIASLQKAAVLSLSIGLLSGVWVRGLSRSTISILLGVLVISMTAISLFLDRYFQNIFLLLFETFLGTADARLASDVSVFQSIIDRSSELPVIALSFHGEERLLLGVGVFGGSGGLGYPNIPHPHNLLVENLIVFGRIGGLVCCLLLSYVLFKSAVLLLRMAPNIQKSEKIAAGSLINLIIPAIFSGGLFYHPASATLFWLSLIIVFSRERAVTA